MIEFEDAKDVFRDRQITEWPTKKGQMANNDLENTTQKTKDRTTRIPLKTASTQLLREGKQFLLHEQQPSCHSLQQTR
jgi:hypothetical protein